MDTYYIQKKQSKEKEGPYSIKDLLTLAKAGKLEPTQKYYDPSLDTWMEVRSNETLKKHLFPQSEKLSLNESMETKAATNAKYETNTEVKSLLLGAASSPVNQRYFARNSLRSIVVVTVILVLSGFSLTFPYYQELLSIFHSGHIIQLFENPLIGIGLVDFILAFILLLGTNLIFPIIRFRALAGIIYFGYIFWALHEPIQAITLTIGHIGLFGITLAKRQRTQTLFCSLGLLGIACFTFLVLFK